MKLYVSEVALMLKYCFEIRTNVSLIFQAGILHVVLTPKLWHERLFLLPYDLQVVCSLCQEGLSSSSCSMFRELNLGLSLLFTIYAQLFNRIRLFSLSFSPACFFSIYVFLENLQKTQFHYFL